MSPVLSFAAAALSLSFLDDPVSVLASSAWSILRCQAGRWFLFSLKPTFVHRSLISVISDLQIALEIRTQDRETPNEI